MNCLLGFEYSSIVQVIMPSSSATRAKEDISLVDIVAFDYVFSDLFFFDGVLKDINPVDRTVFKGDIEPVKSAA
jgi:hypothetical protein